MASLDDLEDRLSCGLCMELYDERIHVPKLLHCAHSICKPCLQNLISSTSKASSSSVGSASRISSTPSTSSSTAASRTSSAPSSSSLSSSSSSATSSQMFACPFCRESIPILNINRYRSNLTLLDMLPLLTNSLTCKLDTEGDTSTSEQATYQPSTLNDGVSEVESADDSSKCSSHGNPVTSQCRTCEVYLCTECLIQELSSGTHKGHDMKMVKRDVQTVMHTPEKRSGVSKNQKPSLQHCMSMDSYYQERISAQESNQEAHPNRRDSAPCLRTPETCEDFNGFYLDPKEAPAEPPDGLGPRRELEDLHSSEEEEDDALDNVTEFLDDMIADISLEAEPVVESVRVMYHEADRALRDVENALIQQERELQDTASEVYDEVVSHVQRGISGLVSFFR